MTYYYLFPIFLIGSDGEFSWHCFSRKCLLLVWRTASHHFEFNWAHSHLWKTALWVQQVRCTRTQLNSILKKTNINISISTLYHCQYRNNDVDYMELRLWIGLHSCLQCFLLVFSDASYIIKYMTRFTEEGFSSLISFIFISDAIKKMVGNIF